MKRKVQLQKSISKIAIYGFHISLFLIALVANAKDATPSSNEIEQYTAIPDENFEQILIKLGYDSGNIDHKVLTANIVKVTFLDLSGKKISDLTGVQDFTALTDLRCAENQLTKLDVSKNVFLISLDCRYNQLTSLDVSKNTVLTTLYTTSNPLGLLDLSKNIALIDLQCEDNKLTILDLTKNISLNTVWCNRNQIAVLDITQNNMLTVLRCFGNQLSILDASKNTALTYLDCKNNNLVSLNAQNGNNKLLKYFEVEGNPGLLCIQADTNKALSSDWSKDKSAKYSKTGCK